MVQSVLAQFDNPRFSASTSGWWPPLKKTPSSHGVRMESTGVAEMCGLIIYIYIADTWNQKPWCPSSPVWGGWFLIRCRLSQGRHTCRKLPLYTSAILMAVESSIHTIHLPRQITVIWDGLKSSLAAGLQKGEEWFSRLHDMLDRW